MEGKDGKKKSKEISYTYWVSKPTGSEAKIACAPQKIDPKEAEKIASSCRQSSQGSSWNSAGTWEEKAVSSEVMKAHLEKCIEQTKPGGDNWKITGVKDISGECTMVTSKGKKRLGFEYTATLTYEGSGLRGTIKFEEVTDDSEGKFEYTVNSEEGSEEAIKGGMRGIMHFLFEAIKDYKNFA